MPNKIVKIRVASRSSAGETPKFLSDYIPHSLVLKARKHETYEYKEFKRENRFNNSKPKFTGPKYNYYVDFHENTMLEPALKLAGAKGFEKNIGIQVKAVFAEEQKDEQQPTRNSFGFSTTHLW